MGIIEKLVKQSGNPSGILGRIMVKIMNHIDSGLNKWLLEKINSPDGYALDIGCGGGETIFSLLKNNKLEHVVGIDRSIDSVNVAKRKNSFLINDGKAYIIQGSVMKLPFLENHFDIILAVRSHYFWDDFEKAFSEIYRTLKQDGKIFIFSEKYKIQYHMKKYRIDETMTCFLQRIGFKNIVIENKDTVQCITAYK